MYKSSYKALVTSLKVLDIKRAVPNIWIDEEEHYSIKARWNRYWSGEAGEVLNLAYYYEVDYKSMSYEEKKYRIKYLWFKVRTVYNAIRFIRYCFHIKNIAEEM